MNAIVGLIGGMTWRATAAYYEALNRASNARLGGHHTARVLIDSLDFGELERLGNREGDWPAVGTLLAASARRLESAGAACVLLGAHTAHLLADAVAAAVSVPLVHVLDALGAHARSRGHRRVCLFGTRHIAGHARFRDHLARCGIDAAPPTAVDAAAIDALIFGDLAAGRGGEAAAATVLACAARAAAAGFDAVALACTELPALMRGRAAAIPLIDTVALHVEAALEQVLPNSSRGSP